MEAVGVALPKNFEEGGHQKVHVAFMGGYRNVYICLEGGGGLRSLCMPPKIIKYSKNQSISTYYLCNLSNLAMLICHRPVFGDSLRPFFHGRDHHGGDGGDAADVDDHVHQNENDQPEQRQLRPEIYY